jgi:GntR family transcriptional regulator
VYYLIRVRLLTGRPVMVERAVYPEKVGILVAGLDLARDSITQRLEDLGIVFADAEHVIDAIAASDDDARMLGVPPRSPLLRERRLTTDQAATPVEWSDDRYLGTEAAFSVRNSVAVNALSRTPAAVLRPGAVSHTPSLGTVIPALLAVIRFMGRAWPAG